MKRSQSGHKPKYSGVSSAGVSIGGKARLRRKLLGCKDTLEGTTELQAMLSRDTPGNRWAGPHGIEREENMRFIYVPVLMKKKNWISNTKEKEEKWSQRRKILSQIHLGKSLS